MIKPKIIDVRNHYYEYEDAKITTWPHSAVGELISNNMRMLYRKIKFLFYSLGITLGMLVFVKSSKYEIFEKLHYRDLIDGMKKDD